MIYPAIVTSDEELHQVFALSKQNQKQLLDDQEKETEGFVTWLYSFTLLKQLNDLAPHVIVKDDDKVVGYALTALRESRVFHPDLHTFLQFLATINYQDKPLLYHSFYLMGQVCVDKAYRGKGIFRQLYQHHKEVYSKDYGFILTEVSTSNKRSLSAHQAIGFKTIYTYKDAMDEWEIMVWDWN
jgi:ribosomal protein S18 acetylase RimI-like enzyme